MQFSLKRTAMRVVCALLTFALILSIPLTAPMTAHAESYKPYNPGFEYKVGDRTYYDVYGTASRDLSTPSDLFRQALEESVSVEYVGDVTPPKSLPLYQWWRYVGQAAFTGDDDVFGISVTGLDYLTTMDTAFGTSQKYGWNKYDSLHESASPVQALTDIGSKVAERGMLDLNDSEKMSLIHSLENSKLLDDSERQTTFYTVDAIGGYYPGLPGRGVSLMATVFYDLKLSYIETGEEFPSAVTGAKTTEEAISKAGIGGGFTYSEDGAETTYMTGVSNYTPVEVSAQQSLTSTQTVGVENKVSDMKGFQWGLEEKVGYESSITAKVPLFGETEHKFSVEITGSQLWSTEHTTEDSAATTTSGSMESTLSVALPPHTAAVLKQSSSDIGMALKYDYPVAISFKVKHIFLSGLSSSFSHSYSFGSAEAGFTSAADSLYNRWIHRNQSGYEKSHGGSNIDWIAARWDHVTTALCTTNGYGLTINTSYPGRLERLIDTLNSYRPMSVAGGELHIEAKGVSSEVYGVTPIYPLRTVKQAGGAVDYDMSTGDKLYVDNIALEGYDTEGVPYFGFDEERGSWKLVDEKGAELTGSDVPAQLVTNPATGYTSLVANDKDGTVYLKYFIDESVYTYNTNFDKPTKNADLNKTALIQVNVSKQPFKGSITVSGGLTGVVGDPKVNLFDPVDSGLNVFIEDESGKELTRAVIWEAKQVESRGVKIESNFIEFTKPGAFQIRAVSGDVKSDWFTVNALPARALDKIEIADVTSPAALSVDFETLPQTLNLSTLTVEGFDQYGKTYAVASPAFEADGATVYADAVSGDPLIDVTTTSAISVFVKDGSVESNKLDVTFTNLPKPEPPKPEPPKQEAAPAKPNITYDATGGKVSGPATRTVIEKSAYGAHPDAVRTGYTLQGWYTAPTGGTQVTDATIVAQATDHTLYAHWTPNKYKIKFNVNKGNKIKTRSKQVIFGAKVGKLPTVKRKGYVFKGWYTKKKGGQLVAAKTVYKIAADKTLYAQWRKPVLMGKGKLNKKTKSVHIRKAPTKKSAILGYYYKGDRFRIYGKVDRAGKRTDWYKVKYKGKTAYVWAPVVITYQG